MLPKSVYTGLNFGSIMIEAILRKKSFSIPFQ